jgi:uncharacterized membrane protein YfhO
VFSEGSVRVFENTKVLPRAFAVPASGIEVIPDPAAALARLSDPTFDPERTALLPELLKSQSVNENPALGTSESSVVATHQDINKVEISAQVKEPAVLVLSDTYYPGWKVLVDGREEKVLRVNYTFKGVALYPGTHKVRFVYEPFTFWAGLLISIVSGLVISAAALFQSSLSGMGHKSSPPRYAFVPCSQLSTPVNRLLS